MGEFIDIYRRERAGGTMLDLLCKDVIDKVGTYSISKILEDKDNYCFYFSDVYGNAVDLMPMCISKVDKTEQVNSDIEVNGKECDIPLKFMSYKNMVIKKLQECYQKEGK